ncbi:MAG: hypothetical protein KDA61_02935, partial [Planctomycetales bacterium]|nr:hypothetical protein [Planctomycetales bacterium]
VASSRNSNLGRRRSAQVNGSQDSLVQRHGRPHHPIQRSARVKVDPSPRCSGIFSVFRNILYWSELRRLCVCCNLGNRDASAVGEWSIRAATP